MILLVDDNDEFRLAAAEALRLHGLQVVEAVDGEEALGIFANEEIRLLVTDLRLPGTSGEALARRCVQLRPGLPVMVVSSHADADLPVRIGADRVEILGKPVRLARLAARCVALLGGEPAEWTASLWSGKTPPVEPEKTAELVPAAPAPRRSRPNRRRRERRPVVWAFVAAGLIAAMAAIGWLGGQLLRPQPPAAAEVAPPAAPLETLAPIGPIALPPTELRWRDDPRAADYRIQLEADGQGVLLDQLAPASPLPLSPAATAALQPVVAYSWFVEARDPAGRVLAASPPTRFRVVPAAAPP